MTQTQNQIKRTLQSSENLAYLRGLLESNTVSQRKELAEQVCERLGFHDARGQIQLGGCLKALRELEAAGHFTLPPPRHVPGPSTPRRLAEPVEPPREVPPEVSELQCLELIRVSDQEQMRVWNELMIREHPQGAGPLVGRQLRYLIASAHGYLGGLGFAAPALQLADRDAWIGWDREQRRAYLHYVVNLSRFLIRPSVRCQNLASKVLSLALPRLTEDFARQYGYSPWLVESFVDTAHFTGASYRAANWREIGQTQGRGRQDRFNQKALSPNAIYVYPLVPDFRTRMGLSPNAGGGALAPADGLDGPMWGQHEFGGAPLGDVRLSKRLVSVATAQAEAPGRAFSGAAKADWPAVKAYYRLIDQPDESEDVTPSNLLAPHRQRTLRRMMGQPVVLCVQDGSDLNYSTLERCKGLGVIGGNQTGTQSGGLHLHSTLALTANGLPLGVLRADITAPPAPSAGKPRGQSTPIEERKNFIWIEHHRDLVAQAVQMPNTRLIDVCDREADFFDLFDEQRKNPRVELLVRAQHDRKVDETPRKLFAAVRESPISGWVRVTIPRKSARPKKGKQAARSAQKARHAELAIRFKRLRMRPTQNHKDKAPIDLWVVHAREEHPPAGTEPVEWFLLTTLRIVTAEEAGQCLRWYCLRWRIEDWHRVLKSGCRIEDLAHHSAERLGRAIAINLVIAWRIMLMTLLGREQPELPAEILFSDIELRALHAYAKKKT